MARPPATSLEEIAALDTPCIRPCDVAGALHVDQFLINLLFKRGTPPFPGYMSGNRCHIYRVPFLMQVGYYSQQGGDKPSVT